MRRRHLSIRVRTTVAQRLPVDYQERAAIFRTYCREKITAPSHIYEAAAGKLCLWAPRQRICDDKSYAWYIFCHWFASHESYEKALARQRDIIRTSVVDYMHQWFVIYF
ncbi:hypothetical protein D4764_03G0012510 [Takifugu flavidus]|uniref:Uncharacterized protein n=1 Tax=Takifugu flavidus TaxID=433684 RepID=A0A5C6NAU3_9TELE|nr:hypothetical protein D4764_03G0012510 [Takifugu flavidus]